MTHDELLAKIEEIHKSCSAGGSDKDVPKSYNWPCYNLHSMAKALRAVVELHKVLLVKNYDNDTDWYSCQACGGTDYPCDTIEAIEKELQ